METSRELGNVFDTDDIMKVLLKIAPPVMLTQLIQALYNIVDSFFVGQYSGYGLTALSVIFPVQWIIQALAVGTGTGVNTLMASLYARGRRKQARETAGTGMVLSAVMWLIFSAVITFILRPYVHMSASSPDSIAYAMQYGKIVCYGSLGIFLESNWTKVHQASGNMRTPMIAQITGALVNIVLDPVLIFGLGPVPVLGIRGAAIATVTGQFIAALIVGVKGIHRPPQKRIMGGYIRRIYSLGIPTIFMQSVQTLYIVVLNIILAGFSDEAVTVLGLYFKLQAFFFIPLISLMTAIVPALSYNNAKGIYARNQRIMKDCCLISAAFMFLAMLIFEMFPAGLIEIFSKDAKVIGIGCIAFREIGTSFLPVVFSLIMPVYFQAVGKAKESIFLSLVRQVFCFIPIFWGLSFLGVNYVWWTFLASEVITSIFGISMYVKTQKKIYKKIQSV